MTYQGDFTLPDELLEQITAQGFEFLPELIRILLNAAMRAERQQYLGAAPCYENKLRGHGNHIPHSVQFAHHSPDALAF